MNRFPALLVATASLFLAACGDSGTGADARRDTRDAMVVGARADVSDPEAPRSGPDNQRVFRFRSVEDPRYPADRSVCAAAPFQTNVFLGASLWSEAASAAEGRVVNESVKRVGTATACIRITDPTFPPGLPQQFYVRFELPEGTYTASGACTLISNDVPTPGLVLGGCHLRVTDAPSWVAGGAATSISVFNPRNLAGFATGSEWALHVYDR